MLREKHLVRALSEPITRNLQAPVLVSLFSLSGSRPMYIPRSRGKPSSLSLLHARAKHPMPRDLELLLRDQADRWAIYYPVSSNSVGRCRIRSTVRKGKRIINPPASNSINLEYSSYEHCAALSLEHNVTHTVMCQIPSSIRLEMITSATTFTPNQIVHFPFLGRLRPIGSHT
ncbi:hypothetical protein FRC12_022438 [Ceratobasidium sp. 428]|nr:hypothetical protein FRC12_022438 [Ceratobasidium sp. 428]